MITHEITRKNLLRDVDFRRIEATAKLDPTQRAEMGQFLPPASIAEFMAGLVCERPETLCVLDAGAGVGFDGVFTRLKKQAEDQPISAPGSREM